MSIVLAVRAGVNVCVDVKELFPERCSGHPEYLPSIPDEQLGLVRLWELC